MGLDRAPIEFRKLVFLVPPNAQSNIGSFLSNGERVLPPLLPVKGERGEILGNTGILWQYGIITLLNFNRQDFVSKHLPKPLTFGEGKR